MTCPPFRHCVFPRSARRAGGAVVLAAILPGWAAAQTGAIPETPAVPGSAMLQMLLGLALVISIYRNRKTVNLDELDLLKG